MNKQKRYTVEVQGADSQWHKDSDHATRTRAERRHRDLCSAGYSPIRLLTPAGNVVNESRVIDAR